MDCWRRSWIGGFFHISHGPNFLRLDTHIFVYVQRKGAFEVWLLHYISVHVYNLYVFWISMSRLPLSFVWKNLWRNASKFLLATQDSQPFLRGPNLSTHFCCPYLVWLFQRFSALNGSTKKPNKNPVPSPCFAYCSWCSRCSACIEHLPQKTSRLENFKKTYPRYKSFRIRIAQCQWYTLMRWM